MSEDRQVLVQFKDVCKTFNEGKTVVMDHFSFDFLKGETHVICGRSGAGKSTLIRCINYLEQIDSGEINMDGIVLDKKTAIDIRKSGPIESLHVPKAEAIEGAEKYLEKVGLKDKMNSKPGELSGGQQQRVAIARALNMTPELILFDEPTSALDPEMVGEVIDIMEELSAEHRSMIVVTHEMGFAKAAADRISFLEGGRFLETNTPIEFFEHPKNESLAKFISQIQ